MIGSQDAYRWVTSLYLMQGIPFGLVAVVSPVIYKAFNLSNSEIALYTSLFTLPWVLKVFFSPALERISTKRNITLFSQFSLAFFIFLLGCSIFYYEIAYYTGIIFTVIAIFGAVQDITIDGIYLESLSLKQQAKFIGIRTICYQLGKLIAQGGLIYFVGWLSITYSTNFKWSIACYLLSFLVLIFTFYNFRFIPVSKIFVDHSNKGNLFETYQTVLLAFSKQPKLWASLGFIFIYNFPESQMMKILPLFMLDGAKQGGLALSFSEVGVIYGVVSVAVMLIGAFLSGFLLEKFTLKKCLIIFTLLATLTNASFLLFDFYPMNTVNLVTFCVIISQFAFGLSNGAYMYYLVGLFSNQSYAMSFYAISTATMLFGVIFSGSIAGYIQYFLGYYGFFIYIVTLGLIITLFSIFYMKSKT